MNKQIALIVIFISSNESLGQNFKYLRKYDSNMANVEVVGGIGNDPSESKSSYDHASRTKIPKPTENEHMHFFDEGTSWKRFLGMSMDNDPKEQTLSYSLINDSRTKKASSKKSSKKASSSFSNKLSSESTPHKTKKSRPQYSHENAPNKYRAPIVSNTTKQTVVETLTSTQKNVIKIVDPTPLPTQKGVYFATETPSTVPPSFLPVSQLSTSPAYILKVPISTTLPTSKWDKPVERPSQMYLSTLPTTEPTIHQTYSPSKMPITLSTYDNVVAKSKCNKQTVDNRKSTIETLLKQFSVDFKSPIENEAFLWLTEEDEGCSIVDHRKILQRYILASFYFATSGDGWSRCNQNDQKCENRSFLSSKSECEWYGVKCNQDGFVSNIYIGKNIFA